MFKIQLDRGRFGSVALFCCFSGDHLWTERVRARRREQGRFKAPRGPGPVDSAGP